MHELFDAYSLFPDPDERDPHRSDAAHRGAARGAARLSVRDLSVRSADQERGGFRTATSCARPTRCATRGATPWSPCRCSPSGAACWRACTRPSACCRRSWRPASTSASCEVETLLEGDGINTGGEDDWEPVMHVTGRYGGFAHLETPLLGVLARRSLVASQHAHGGGRGARQAHHLHGAAPRRLARADAGRLRRAGGRRGQREQRRGRRVVGRARRGHHAARHDRRLQRATRCEATLAFARYLRDEEPDVQVMSLVDYDNDAVETSLAVARAMRAEFGDGVLTGVRVDTSERLIDDSLIGDPEVWGRAKLTGVNALPRPEDARGAGRGGLPLRRHRRERRVHARQDPPLREGGRPHRRRTAWAAACWATAAATTAC